METPERHHVPYSGAASFTYTVCDNGFTAGLSDPKCSSGTVNVDVTDTTPPAMSDLKLNATQLWPPNHQMVPITVDYSATDLGDPAPVCTLSIASNEPINGTGDGDTAPDWTIVDAHHVMLRAERAAGGTGHTYTITAACADKRNNAAQKIAAVKVPKSQK